MQRVLALRIQFVSCLPLRTERVAQPLSIQQQKIAHVHSSIRRLANKH